MTLANPDMTYSAAPRVASAADIPAVGVRDPRLDFFRGIAMFIILIAHVPGNWLTLWIPARFGFSDATEIFVFCSGMASAIAFGRVFREQGLPMGTARVAFRVWQVYWAHIGLFLAVAVTMVVLNMIFPDGRNYVGQLNLHPFFKNTDTNLLGLVTLTYVPNYFDILPMYLVILAMMPVMVALARIHVGLMIAASVTLWLLANFTGLNFPAEPWSERGWFFNPFGWQLIFFTGFALMGRFVSAPPVDKRLFWAAVVVVLIIVPFAYFRIHGEIDFIREWRKDWKILINKTDFGILRYVHFLAMAYVAWVLVGPKGDNIQPRGSGTLLDRSWTRILTVIMKVGQQSLAVFIGSMYVARLLGAIFDQVGRNHFSMFWVNALGFAAIIGVAYGAGWFKAQPWKTKRAV
ncbi:MAG: OpgC domain-containing protein [Pseudomonadota bacterium]